VLVLSRDEALERRSYLPFKDELVAWGAPKIVVDPAMMSGSAEVARIQRVIATYSEDKCRQLAADFVADGTWQVPTLIRQKTSEQRALMPLDQVG